MEWLKFDFIMDFAKMIHNAQFIDKKKNAHKCTTLSEMRQIILENEPNE